MVAGASAPLPYSPRDEIAWTRHLVSFILAANDLEPRTEASPSEYRQCQIGFFRPRLSSTKAAELTPLPSWPAGWVCMLTP